MAIDEKEQISVEIPNKLELKQMEKIDSILELYVVDCKENRMFSMKRV
jgi:hypothetical protein